MRPLRLEFEAFGSYPGRHVVDFEALGRRGLFVVAGPTGTGKTTIFDAMVYGLYGVLPGARAGVGEPRSHHADAAVETFVQLDFEVDGARYRVYRTPQQERPKRRGPGTTVQPAGAFLSKLVGEGTEALVTQTNKVTEECVHLVGLEAKHFQRVVLLPQSKFTEFLVANDESREQLLRQLFGGELYERATKVLKQRADELDQQVFALDEAVRHHRANALQSLVQVQAEWGDPTARPDTPQLFDDLPLTDDQMLASIAALQPVRKQHAAAVAALQRQAKDAHEASALAEAAAARFNAAQHHRSVLLRLAATADQTAADEAAVQASRRARPVVVAAATVDDAQAAAHTATEALAVLRSVVTDGFAALRRPAPAFDAPSVAASVQRVAQQLDDQLTLLDASRRARREADEALALVERTAAEHAALADVAQQMQERVEVADGAVQHLRPAAGGAVLCQTRFHAASARVSTRRRLDEYEVKADQADADATDEHQAYVALMEQFIASAAPRLASTLNDGVACPVCGSPEHPHPAAGARGAVVDIAQVDAARGRAAATAGAAQSHRAVAQSLRESLGDDAMRSLDELLADEAAAAEALKAAQRADFQLQAAEAARGTAEIALKDAVTAQTDKGLSMARHRVAAELAAAEAVRRVGLVVGLDAEQVRVDTATATALAEATRHAGASFDAVTAAAATLATATAAFDDALVTSGFRLLGEARAALLAAAEETTREQRAAEWRRVHAQSATILAELERDGIPAAAPDLDQARRLAARTDRAANEAAQRFTTVSNALDRSQSEVSASLDVAADTAPMRRRRDTARRVFRTCNGEAGMRVKLERWVLASELERVTHAANDHLVRMTNHRYRLARVAGQRGGLGLEVFDAHTGRSRATASLSGGEQFQASLALALGLADVVSHGGSGKGKHFEALFVDEGFGTLDPTALDDAIGALQQLQSAGRIVGAITHVEAMKQQLHVGIEVASLPGGRGSTLTVYP